MFLRARDIKERINKWDFIKIKSFCMAKGKSIKMKREPTIWENIFTNDTSDKGLISKIYKELTWLYSRKTNNPIKKWEKVLNRHFSKDNIQRVQRHMKGCLVSLAIRQVQIKTHFNLITSVLNTVTFWAPGHKDFNTWILGGHSSAHNRSIDWNYEFSAPSLVKNKSFLFLSSFFPLSTLLTIAICCFRVLAEEVPASYFCISYPNWSLQNLQEAGAHPHFHEGGCLLGLCLACGM